ncbi:hypothetical protein K9M47_00885 [Candidatus Gracilibacteria bacterium]|nr:hypothetical protein [Candidatus Gracilibacteria bacterium]MCF7898431.1 hypothetical protein [Candidatus Paceibacterota bacterium]
MSLNNDRQVLRPSVKNSNIKLTHTSDSVDSVVVKNEVSAPTSVPSNILSQEENTPIHVIPSMTTTKSINKEESASEEIKQPVIVKMNEIIPPSEVRNKETPKEDKEKEEKISDALQKLLDLKIGKAIANAEASLETVSQPVDVTAISQEPLNTVTATVDKPSLGQEIKIQKPETTETSAVETEQKVTITPAVTESNIVSSQTLPQVGTAVSVEQVSSAPIKVQEITKESEPVIATTNAPDPVISITPNTTLPLIQTNPVTNVSAPVTTSAIPTQAPTTPVAPITTTPPKAHWFDKIFGNA